LGGRSEKKRARWGAESEEAESPSINTTKGTEGRSEEKSKSTTTSPRERIVTSHRKKSKGGKSVIGLAPKGRGGVYLDRSLFAQPVEGLAVLPSKQKGAKREGKKLPLCLAQSASQEKGEAITGWREIFCSDKQKERPVPGKSWGGRGKKMRSHHGGSSEGPAL